MSSTNTVAVLDGMFKEIYAEKIKNLIPDGTHLINEFDFAEDSKQLGNLYHQPVVLALEHGVTYGGSSGEAFNLNASVSGVMKDAQVQGYEMVLRSSLSVAAASRSQNDKGAFQKATKFLVANMLRSFSRRLEVQLFYGQATTGIGKVSSVAGNVLTITNKTWAPGIWAGGEGMPIDVYVGAVYRGTATVNSVSFDNKTITLNAAPAGTATDDILYYKGAYGNEFAGIDKIIRNTGSLFNINASTYNLWQGNVLGNSGTGRNISFAIIEQAISRAVEKGLLNQDVLCLVNPAHWDILLTDQAALRDYDHSYTKEKFMNGAKQLEFYGQSGMIKIVPSIFVKLGSCYIVPPEEFMRVGSSDITFEQPGFPGQFFRLLSDANGFELRLYTDQALFCMAPGKCIVIDDVEGA